MWTKSIQSNRLKVCLCLISITWCIALWSMYLYFNQRHIAILLFSLVCLGTGYDFWGTIAGRFIHHRKTLLFFARTRYSLANFGILFTPFTAIFILSELQKHILDTYSKSSHIYLSKIVFSNWFTQHYFYFLLFSLLIGLPYLFSRYALIEEKDYPVIKEDKSKSITFVAFLLRRLILLFSLFLAIAAVVDGFLIKKYFWTGAFLISFLASVPLHIFKKMLSAMIVEVTTLIILFLGINIYLI